MRTTPRSLRVGPLLSISLLLGLAGSAAADRPSLVDMQATVDQVVNGLCEGDAAACGASLPEPAVGTIVLDPIKPVPLDLVELSLSASRNFYCNPDCVPNSYPQFSSASATVLQAESAGLLTLYVLNGNSTSEVEVILPGTGRVLTFQQVLIESISQADEYGRVKIQFQYSYIRFEWQGEEVDWNLTTNQGHGCNVHPAQTHVDLAGNSPSNLGAEDVEATYGMTVEPFASTTVGRVSLTRSPPDPCLLREFTSLGSSPSFERLWASNDQFPAGRQAIDTITLTDGFIQSWQLVIRSGELTEYIDFVIETGSATFREFDPATGEETDSITVAF